MAKSPAFQWYPRDILSSMRVQEMTLAEEGAYRRLIDYCWINGYVPSDPKRAARIIGKGATVEMAQVALAMFTQDPDNPERMYHDRLLEEEEKQNAHRQQRVDAAKARWGNRGTPEKGIGTQDSSKGDAEAMRPHTFRICDTNASAMRKRCSSSSSSDNITPSNTRTREDGFSLEEVLEAAKLPDVAVSEAEARKFFDHYNGEWTYGNGKPITCLATALRRWKGKQEQFQQKGRNHGNENNFTGRPNRNAGTYNDNDEPAIF